MFENIYNTDETTEEINKTIALIEDEMIKFKDAMNNIGLPDLADQGVLYFRKDYRRVREQMKAFEERYGESFTESDTAKFIRKLVK